MLPLGARQQSKQNWIRSKMQEVMLTIKFNYRENANMKGMNLEEA